MMWRPMGGSRTQVLVAGLIAAAVCLAWPGEAEAQIPPIQAQLLAVGTAHVLGEEFNIEAQANLAIYGVGLAVGLGGEGLRGDDGRFHGGGTFHLAIQFRPMMFIAINPDPPHPVYHVFDPHLDVGGLIGAISWENGAAFRGVFYVGGALDFAIPLRYYHMDSQVVFSLGYRWIPYQTPDGPEHQVLFGIGWRGGL
jgi:hypothetical protein